MADYCLQNLLYEEERYMNVKIAFFKMSNELYLINSMGMPEVENENIRILKSLKGKVDFAVLGQFNIIEAGKKSTKERPNFRLKYTHYKAENTAWQDIQNKNLDFINPVGSLDTRQTAGYPVNGRVNYDDFYNSFYNPMEDNSLFNRMPSTPPLFAIVDHNSAHHMSYVLACKGFTCFGEGWHKRIVINFDHHNDYTLEDHKGIIGCENWGDFLRMYPPADAYIVIGVKGSTSSEAKITGWYRHVNSQGFVSTIDLERLGINFNLVASAEKKVSDIVEVLKEVKAKINEKISCDQLGGDANWLWEEENDVYITVDRDFMQFSGTSYGPGSFPIDLGRKAVAECLGYLSNQRVTLVGFDVTGLPVSTKEGNMRELQKIAWEDIKYYYDAVCRYGTQTMAQGFTPAKRS
jgi:hypothetical protein